MIFQPFKNAELQLVSLTNQLATRQNCRGQTGLRIWNVNPWWWEVLGDGEPSRPQGLVPPWSFTEVEFESDQMLEVLVQSTTDLPSEPLSRMSSWRLMLQFVDQPVEARIRPLGALTATDLENVPFVSVNPQPAGSTPINASSGDVANATATATLAAAAGQFTYLSGFVITGAGATGASVVTATVAGVTGGPLSYDIAVPAGAAVGITPLMVTFTTPVRSSAVNTAIVVSAPPFGAGNLHAAVSATGFQDAS